MEKWEYRIIHLAKLEIGSSFELSYFEARLNEAGDEGWKVVGNIDWINYRAIMERQKREIPKSPAQQPPTEEFVTAHGVVRVDRPESPAEEVTSQQVADFFEKGIAAGIARHEAELKLLDRQ